MLFFLLGIARVHSNELNRTNDTLSKLNDRKEKITLIGRVAQESDIRESIQRLKVKVENTESIVLVTTRPYPEYRYLDSIKITGTLKSPPIFENFNYKNYLMKDSIFSVMDFPEIELVSEEKTHTPFTFFYEKLLFGKEGLIGSINNIFPTPQNVILQGIIFGHDKNMPKYLKNQFNTTGLSHLTAVSGSNIVLLISLFMYLMLLLGFWRRQAFYCSLFFIWIYIMAIGFPVSGVRAAIMGSVVLFAEVLGRQNSSGRIIVATATIMLFQNPLLLAYDVSFQLSFLASMGIIYIKPIFEGAVAYSTWLKETILKYPKIKGIIEIISVTVAAQIATLPLLTYTFGTISLISLVTNILILPIIPFLTVMGFLTALVGMLSDFLAFIVSLPTRFLLEYFLKVLDIFSQPWAIISFDHISWVWIMLYYLLVSFSVFYFNKKIKPQFLG